MKLRAQIPTEPALNPLWQFVTDALVSGLRLHKGTLGIPSMTEAQRDTLDAENGMALYNTDSAKHERYENDAWVSSPVNQSAAYTPTNVSTDRAFDADTVAVAELADVVGTLIADLQASGLIQ